MSYWVYLEDENEKPVSVVRHMEGGTLMMGGNTKAELNVTYNYSVCYRLADFHLKDLIGKKATDTIEVLEAVVEKLGTHTYKDYWAPTPGNAGHAASILLAWAKQHPDAVWRVS